MMQAYLEGADEWERYLELLCRFPGEERELEARASLMVEEGLARGLERAEAVARALERAEELQLALARGASPPRPAPNPRLAPSPAAPLPPRPVWRRWALGGLGLAAGLTLAVVMQSRPPPGPEPGLRGAEQRGDGGSVSLWGEALGEAALRERLGRGTSPRVAYRPGPAHLRWWPGEAEPGRRLVAYLVDQSGTLRGLDGSPDPTEVSGAASFELGPGLRALVVLSLPLEERPAEVAALVQDGGQAVGTAGSWQALVFRLEEQP